MTDSSVCPTCLCIEVSVVTVNTYLSEVLSLGELMRISPGLSPWSTCRTVSILLVRSGCAWVLEQALNIIEANVSKIAIFLPVFNNIYNNLSNFNQQLNYKLMDIQEYSSFFFKGFIIEPSITANYILPLFLF
jgi:hypothetical protein